MLINKANVASVFVNIRATFNQAFEATPTQYQNYATLLDTQQITEQMDWVGDLPNWREWVGDKQIQSIAAHTYSLTCVEWETTIEVKRRDLEADRLGIYAIKAKNSGELAAYFPEERVAVEVWPQLTSATAWFLLGESGGLKPFVLVQRKKPTPVQVIDPNDSFVVKSGKFLFGIEADAVAGYTFPQLAYGSTGAG